jgi:8-oxo-dGTP diphosphatase
MSGAPGARRPVTPVAVGVLVRGDGAVLLADRPAGKPYASYWEFPGGKIEPGESVDHALARELVEELGIRIGPSVPWVVMEYEYPHARVRLHFRRVFEWEGTPRPVEGQRLAFLFPGKAPPAPLLPAAVPAMRWIQLPSVAVLSPGTAGAPAQAIAWLETALARGAGLILWHEPGLGGADLEMALARCRARAREYGALLLVDARCPGAQPAQGGDVLLDIAQLRAADARPAGGWVGARVATVSDLDRAARLGCDFALAAGALGAGAGGDAGHALPLYVESEPSAAALEWARRQGAHGLAIRGLPG